MADVLLFVVILQCHFAQCSLSQTDQSSLQEHVRVSGVVTAAHAKIVECIKKMKEHNARVTFSFKVQIDEQSSEEIVYTIASSMPYEKRCRVIVTSRKTMQKK